MPNKFWGFLVATASYALLLGLAALILPDPRVLLSPGAQVDFWHRQDGFHVSWFGAVMVGAIMALILSGIRAWLTQRISGTGFNWPTLAGGFLAVLLVLIFANGILWQNTFFIHGWLGWLVTPLLVWLGTFVYDRFDNRLVGYARQATGTVQGQVTAIRQALPHT
jgi:hypothetical protein